MCTVSFVGDYYGDRLRRTYPQTIPTDIATGQTIYTGISRAEFDALKAEVEQMKDELIAAKKADEEAGTPDCEMDEKAEIWDDPEPIHLWFNLTYANYLVLPRALLQSMPQEWQARFVRCLAELDAMPFEYEPPYSYRVSAVDERGRFCRNRDPHYNRGRTVVPLRSAQSDAPSASCDPASERGADV